MAIKVRYSGTGETPSRFLFRASGSLDLDLHVDVFDVELHCEPKAAALHQSKIPFE
jgi:hypothetical protein